ncbi:unnamed protein product, partial [Pylaiella littoralis]
PSVGQDTSCFRLKQHQSKQQQTARREEARGTPKSLAGGGALRVVPQEMKSPQPFHRVRWAACGRNQQWQQGGQGAAKSNHNHAQIAYCTWCSQKKDLKQHRTASAFAISKE